MNDVEIDDLLSKFLAGEASPDEAMKLEDWMKTSAVNQEVFMKALTIFKVPQLSDEDKAKTKAWDRILGNIKQSSSSNSGKSINMWLKIAASVILIIGIGFIINQYFNKPNELLSYKAVQEKRIVQLADASEITIYPNSSITLSNGYGTTNRNIELNGSAAFSVKHDDDKPFIISVNKFYIKDIGTKFTVSASEKDTVIISVQEGEVLVYDNSGSVASLFVNDSARYVHSTKMLYVSKHSPKPESKVTDSKTPIIPKPTSKEHDSLNKVSKDTIPKKKDLFKADSSKGTVLFECNRCSEKGNLLFILLPDSIPTATGFLFDKEVGSSIYKHKEQLAPGKYLWYFSDYANLKTSGSVIVKKNEEVRVKLFN